MDPEGDAVANGRGTLVLREMPTTSVFVLRKIIDAEFFVVVKGQLANDRAEGDLRCFHVHFVEDFLDLHHHLAITQHDDGIGARVSDQLGVADDHRLRRGIDRLRR